MNIGSKVRVNMPSDKWLHSLEGEVVDIIDAYVDGPVLYLVQLKDSEEIFDETELVII